MRSLDQSERAAANLRGDHRDAGRNGGCDRCTLLHVIPWIIIAVVAVPLVVIAFLSMRRNVAATEQPETDDERARTEQEFAEAEAFEAQWHEEDKERSTRNACRSARQAAATRG